MGLHSVPRPYRTEQAIEDLPVRPGLDSATKRKGNGMIVLGSMKPGHAQSINWRGKKNKEVL